MAEANSRERLALAAAAAEKKRRAASLVALLGAARAANSKDAASLCVMLYSVPATYPLLQQGLNGDKQALCDILAAYFVKTSQLKDFDLVTTHADNLMATGLAEKFF